MTTHRLLVVGGTGTNGRSLLEQLKAQDVPVRTLVRSVERARPMLGEEVELVEGDLSEPSSLDAALDGIQTAYVLLAVLPNTVELFANFFAAAQRAGVRRVVKFSGLGASVDSPSEIIRQHAEADDMLRSSGLGYTLLRPNSFHQNMLWQAPAIAASGTFYLPVGDARQSTIDVRDIAAISARVLLEDGHDGATYDLTGPESLSFNDVAAIIGEERGEPVSFVPVPQEVAEQAMLQQGMDAWSARALAEIQALFGTGAYADVLPDTEQLLKRTPTSFRQFVRDYKPAFVAGEHT